MDYGNIRCGNAALTYGSLLLNDPQDTILKRKDNCLICLNGELKKSLISEILHQNPQRNAYSIIAADGVSSKLLNYKIQPDIIIGDMDSLNSSIIQIFKRKDVRILKIPDQESNDFEKSVVYAVKNGFKNILVVGYNGKRTDHEINNFNVIIKFRKKCNIKLLDTEFEIQLLPFKSEFRYKKGKPISLFAFPAASGITTKGLMFQLRNEKLELGGRQGALNKASDNRIKINFKSGTLLIFKKHFQKLSFKKLFPD